MKPRQLKPNPLQSGTMVRIRGKLGVVQSTPRPNLYQPKNLGLLLVALREKRIKIPRYLGKIRVKGKTLHVVERVGSRKRKISRTETVEGGVKHKKKGNTLREFIRDVIINQGNEYGRQPLGIITKVFSSAARTLARLHREGYAHGHPHFDNFVVRKRETVLIDFKYLRKKKPDWNDPESVYQSFYDDYAVVRLTFDKIKSGITFEPLEKLFNRQQEFFFRKMVSRYPMSESNKKALLDKIQKIKNE